MLTLENAWSLNAYRSLTGVSYGQFIGELPKGGLHIPNHFMSALIPRHDIWRDWTGTQPTGSGSNVEFQPSLRAGIGEVAERTAFHLVATPNEIKRNVSHRELEAESGIQLTPPFTFNLFSPKQYATDAFPFSEYTTDLRQGWAPAIRLVTNGPSFVPLSLVSSIDLSLQPLPTSNGCSAGANFDQAVSNALCELVERDAFMAHWRLTHLPRWRIEIEDLLNAPTLEVFRPALSAIRRHLTVLHLPTDIPIPVFCAVFYGDPPHTPPLLVSAGAHRNPNLAVATCLRELLQALGSSTFDYRLDRYRAVRTAADIHDFSDHVHYYWQGDRRDEIKFFTDVPTRPFHEISSAMDRGEIEILSALGYQPLAVKMTSCITKRLGLTSVRCIVPGLLQIEWDHRFPFLGGPRLRQLAQSLGGIMEDLEDGALNLKVHPFP